MHGLTVWFVTFFPLLVGTFVINLSCCDDKHCLLLASKEALRGLLLSAGTMSLEAGIAAQFQVSECRDKSLSFPQLASVPSEITRQRSARCLWWHFLLAPVVPDLQLIEKGLLCRGVGSPGKIYFTSFRMSVP